MNLEPLLDNNTLPPFAKRLRAAADRIWEDGYNQPFIRELGAGTLAPEQFAFYLTQDTLYLRDYAKVHAIAATKTDDLEIMDFMAQVQASIVHGEMTMQREFLESYHLDPATVAGAKQSAFAYAYTSNILSVAYTGDLVDILVAILPCAWVYADYGRRLANEFADELDSNPYKPWIDMYRTDEFWASGRWLIDHIEPIARTLPESRLEQLETLFVRGVGYEYMFWDSAYRMQMQWKKEWQ
ncbi:thiaminase II [Bifidobacterium magnum]|uniref:Aminopyrimidine aminohydrolase n=1 Tax=Bifidobacterium magnum TaxID=1692 RepID=A0A087BCU2_9BIFI|nr:thiaminase II [Bifidobacterium magnum]KFI68842.1 TenA-like transcriptional activator [Bifidobacterium magnum]